jgi:hypothetical protein
MANQGTMIMRALSLAAGATGTMNFGQAVSQVKMRNGGSKAAFWAVGAVAPTPSVGDGRSQIAAGQLVEIGDTIVEKISVAMPGTDATSIEAIGIV